MLIVIAQYLTKPGAADEVAQVLRRHAADSRAEPGCLEFTVHQSVDSPERFVLYERYTGEDAFDAHRTSPHFAANIEAVTPLLAERTFGRYAILGAELAGRPRLRPDHRARGRGHPRSPSCRRASCARRPRGSPRR